MTEKNYDIKLIVILLFCCISTMNFVTGNYVTGLVWAVPATIYLYKNREYLL